ncbi:unnamed protein product, partial [Coregonus sp. 'balchen']
LCASQQTVQSVTQQVKGIVGQSLTFPERVFKTGYLRYGEDTNAFVLNGQSQTDPEERFKNRLHWDNVTGLFRLSDVQIEDAGVTECDNSSCSVVCSVDNEKEVTLTLYLGEEKLNQTSSRDLTTNLRLEVEGKDYNSAYSCVAANPVSNKTALVPKCCSEDGHHKETDSDEMTRGMLIIAVICVLVVLGLVGLAIYLKKRGNEHSQGRYLSFRDSSERVQVDIEYATITYKEQTDNQEERTGIPELESCRDNPELTSVYDTLLLYRMAASGDVDTA